MLRLIRTDVRSTTGSNLRNILLQSDKVHVDQLQPVDILGMEYHPVHDEHKWKIKMIKEILDIRSGKIEIDDFDNDELSEILNHLCSD